MTRTLLLSAVSALLLTVAPFARAETLEPVTGQTINLGTVAGTAYYTVEPSGFHVVATLADSRSSAPMRVEATLASGQTMVLSTPGGHFGPPHIVEITRQDEAVVVRAVARTN